MSDRLRRPAPPALSIVAALFALAGPARAQAPQLIYCELTGVDAGVVPGAKDATGAPVTAHFATLIDLVVGPNGEWLVKGTTDQSLDLNNVLVLGAGTAGSVLAQEGQPLLGGEPGEVYDFFDGVAGFDSAGDLAFGARARNGDPTVKEKVLVVTGTSHEVRVHESTPALGLLDLPPAPSGDESFGNSLNSIHLLDDGRVGFVAVTINDIHSSRRPALFYDDLAFRQSGVSAIGAETWDSFDSNQFATTRDGAHWAARGDTENPATTVDDILVIDDAVVVREGDDLGGIVVDRVLDVELLEDGSAYVRGDDALGEDWVLHEGVLIARTGDAIYPGSSEHWGDVILAATGNLLGDRVLAGVTDSLDPLTNVVLVVNDEVLARSGDPVDADGDGIADADIYLRSIQGGDVHITEGRTIYFLASLRNGAGDNLGDAFFRIELAAPGGGFARGDCNDDGAVDIADPVAILAFLFTTPGAPAGCLDACDVNDDGQFDISDAIYGLSALFAGGDPPPPPAPDCGADPTTDALDCGTFSSCP